MYYKEAFLGVRASFLFLEKAQGFVGDAVGGQSCGLEKAALPKELMIEVMRWLEPLICLHCWRGFDSFAWLRVPTSHEVQGGKYVLSMRVASGRR